MGPEFVRLSRMASLVCGALAATVGWVALLGWATGNEGLKAIYAGGIVIKTNTAICLLALGIALVLRSLPLSRVGLRVAAGAAGLAAAIGGATLLQHVFGWDLGIDQLLFEEAAGSPATTSPNRMGPPASICFPLLGVALLLIDRRTPGGRVPSQWLALAAIAIASVPFAGYIFGVHTLYGLASYTGIAFHTAFAFIALGVGVFLARPDAGATARILAADEGGLLLRRLIPASVLLPILLGRLRMLGEQAGAFDASFGRSLFALSMVASLCAVTWWTASVVQRHQAARARAEAAESELQARLLATLDSERQARAAAERSNRVKDEFLATLSHELRTPLNAILGWTNLLRHSALDERDARRGLEAIERNSRLQAQLIDDLLDMSRIEAGKVRLDVQDLDLPLVVESAFAAATPSADEAGVILERHLDGPRMQIEGDPARLNQVFWNLLSNAVKFTPRGGRVVLSATSTDAGVTITVSDTGIGIRPEDLGRIFDRFAQADSSTTRRFGGLGLGLAIARQLTELHGGTLTAESAGEGRGATFRVQLPARPARLVPVRGGGESAAMDGAGAAARQALAGVRVLVVDDHDDAAAYIERLLRDCGAEVQTARDVAGAIDALARGHIDVLVSDVGMPGQDGYDLIRHVRARHAALPAIALTAFVRPEDERRALDAGFDRHLGKPVTAEQLIAALVELVSSRETRNPPVETSTPKLQNSSMEL